MKRKDYQRPTMKVVQLKHRTHLLQVSGEVMQAQRTNYTRGRSDGISSDDDEIWQ